MRKHLFDCARQCSLVIVLFSLTFAQALAQSGNACQVAGIDTVFTDSFEADPFCPEPCLVNAQIQAVRDSADGEVSLPLEHVYVTYIRPTVGNDVTGFFLQGRNHTGPAIYANIDPAGLEPALEVGDVISLTVTEVGDLNGLRSIVRIADLAVEANDQSLHGFVQDVSLSTDLVADIDSYESELISLNGTVSGTFSYAGSGFEAAVLSTPVITGDTGLRLRLPSDLREELSLTQGCMINLCGTPMWRFDSIAQPSAWNENEIDVVSCPAPAVISAAALDANTVKITFDREISNSSVAADGSQFTFDNGLTATAAVVNAYTVELSTSTQVSGQAYQVFVASSVTDTLGAGVDAGANSAVFSGFKQGALLRVNEFNANIAGGCDLVELRVIDGGTMDGIYLKERTGTVITFPDFSVNSGDVIVVHFDTNDSNCNGSDSTNETASTNDQASAQHPQNYDTAYDWYSTDSGVTSTDNVLTLYHPYDGIMDAVLASDAVTGTAAAASETQAAEVASAGHWQMVGGGVPAGGFVDDDFSAHAAQDLNGTGTSAAGDSIQRINDIDNNDKSDWTMTTQSWGALNSGQSN